MANTQNGEGEGNYRRAVQMGSDQTKFAALIRHIGGDLISEDEVEALAVASRLRHFEKGETIIAEGEVPSELFILVSGVVRGYLLDASGKEVTDCILGTPSMVAMPYARLDAPSPSCVQALSTTVLLAVRAAHELDEFRQVERQRPGGLPGVGLNPAGTAQRIEVLPASVTLLGEDQRFLLPGTLLSGALLMVLSSLVAKLLSTGAVMPVGIITSLVGVPFLLLLLVRHSARRAA